MTIALPSAPLRGSLVTLRLWEPEDATWYVAARDEEILRWTNERRDLDVETARANIRRYRSEPTHAGFAIADGISGALLGNVALVVTESEGRVGEVMYWLAAAARGRGAATDAVRTIAAWGFEALALDRIELLTNEGNAASQRVAVRAGFRPAGRRGERVLFILGAGERA